MTNLTGLSLDLWAQDEGAAFSSSASPPILMSLSSDRAINSANSFLFFGYGGLSVGNLQVPWHVADLRLLGWHHLAVTIDFGNATANALGSTRLFSVALYLDGQVMTTRNVLPADLSLDSTWYVLALGRGNRRWLTPVDTSSVFFGSMDNVRIRDYAMTSSDVRYSMRTERPAAARSRGLLLSLDFSRVAPRATAFPMGPGEQCDAGTVVTLAGTDTRLCFVMPDSFFFSSADYYPILSEGGPLLFGGEGANVELVANASFSRPLVVFVVGPHSSRVILSSVFHGGPSGQPAVPMAAPPLITWTDEPSDDPNLNLVMSSSFASSLFVSEPRHLQTECSTSCPTVTPHGIADSTRKSFVVLSSTPQFISLPSSGTTEFPGAHLAPSGSRASAMLASVVAPIQWSLTDRHTSEFELSVVSSLDPALYRWMIVPDSRRCVSGLCSRTEAFPSPFLFPAHSDSVNTSSVSTAAKGINGRYFSMSQDGTGNIILQHNISSGLSLVYFYFCMNRDSEFFDIYPSSPCVVEELNFRVHTILQATDEVISERIINVNLYLNRPVTVAQPWSALCAKICPNTVICSAMCAYEQLSGALIPVVPVALDPDGAMCSYYLVLPALKPETNVDSSGGALVDLIDETHTETIVPSALYIPFRGPVYFRTPSDISGIFATRLRYGVADAPWDQLRSMCRRSVCPEEIVDDDPCCSTWTPCPLTTHDIYASSHILSTETEPSAESHACFVDFARFEKHMAEYNIYPRTKKIEIFGQILRINAAYSRSVDLALLNVVRTEAASVQNADLLGTIFELLPPAAKRHASFESFPINSTRFISYAVERLRSGELLYFGVSTEPQMHGYRVELSGFVGEAYVAVIPQLASSELSRTYVYEVYTGNPGSWVIDVSTKRLAEFVMQSTGVDDSVVWAPAAQDNSKASISEFTFVQSIVDANSGNLALISKRVCGPPNAERTGAFGSWSPPANCEEIHRKYGNYPYTVFENYRLMKGKNNVNFGSNWFRARFGLPIEISSLGIWINRMEAIVEIAVAEFSLISSNQSTSSVNWRVVWSKMSYDSVSDTHSSPVRMAASDDTHVPLYIFNLCGTEDILVTDVLITLDLCDSSAADLAIDAIAAKVDVDLNGTNMFQASHSLLKFEGQTTTRITPRTVPVYFWSYSIVVVDCLSRQFSLSFQVTGALDDKLMQSILGLIMAFLFICCLFFIFGAIVFARRIREKRRITRASRRMADWTRKRQNVLSRHRKCLQKVSQLATQRQLLPENVFELALSAEESDNITPFGMLRDAVKLAADHAPFRERRDSFPALHAKSYVQKATAVINECIASDAAIALRAFLSYEDPLLDPRIAQSILSGGKDLAVETGSSFGPCVKLLISEREDAERLFAENGQSVSESEQAAMKALQPWVPIIHTLAENWPKRSVPPSILFEKLQTDEHLVKETCELTPAAVRAPIASLVKEQGGKWTIQITSASRAKFVASIIDSSFNCHAHVPEPSPAYYNVGLGLTFSLGAESIMEASVDAGFSETPHLDHVQLPVPALHDSASPDSGDDEPSMQSELEPPLSPILPPKLPSDYSSAEKSSKVKLVIFGGSETTEYDSSLPTLMVPRKTDSSKRQRLPPQYMNLHLEVPSLSDPSLLPQSVSFPDESASSKAPGPAPTIPVSRPPTEEVQENRFGDGVNTAKRWSGIAQDDPECAQIVPLGYTPFLTLPVFLWSLALQDPMGWNPLVMARLMHDGAISACTAAREDPHGLSPNHCFAIYVYCAELRIYKCVSDWPLVNTPDALESQPRQLYRDMNAVLRNSDPSTRVPWLPLIFYVDSALRKLPPCRVKLYRGISVPVSTALYSLGNTVSWESFSSTSASRHVAAEFAKGSNCPGTIFVINSINARPVARYSALPGEEEYVLLPGALFDVSHLLSSDQMSIVHAATGSEGKGFSHQIVEVDQLLDPNDVLNTLVTASMCKKLRRQNRNAAALDSLQRELLPALKHTLAEEASLENMIQETKAQRVAFSAQNRKLLHRKHVLTQRKSRVSSLVHKIVDLLALRHEVLSEMREQFGLGKRGEPGSAGNAAVLKALLRDDPDNWWHQLHARVRRLFAAKS